MLFHSEKTTFFSSSCIKWTPWTVRLCNPVNKAQKWWTKAPKCKHQLFSCTSLRRLRFIKLIFQVERDLDAFFLHPVGPHEEARQSSERHPPFCGSLTQPVLLVSFYSERTELTRVEWRSWFQGYIESSTPEVCGIWQGYLSDLCGFFLKEFP